ncbi:MAG: hypothetical protein FWG84_06775 [Bacteroidales bacterium]|nr:hypothetical protein [Bacteroidales bacterium]
MENQVESVVKKDEGRVRIFITYKTKTIAFGAYIRNSLKVTIENIKSLAKTDVQKYWDLPEINNGGQRITYRLGRSEEGKQQILHPTNSKGEEQCLEDYGVKEGDHLILTQKVIAG